MKTEDRGEFRERFPCDTRAAAMRFDQVRLARMEDALHHLLPEQREVLLLVVVERLSYAEAAKALAIPFDTLMSRLAHARVRLQQLVGAAIPT